MRKSISDSITETIAGLNQIGVVNDTTMKNINNLCIPDTHDNKSEEVGYLHDSETEQIDF